MTVEEAARLAAFLVAAAGSMGLVAILIVALHGGGGAGFHPVAAGALASTAVIGAATLVLRPDVLRPQVGPIVACLALVILTLTAFEAGPRQAPFATMFYVWTGSVFLIASQRRAVIAVIVAGALHAALLGLQPGHHSVLAEWEFTFGITALTALTLKRVLDVLLDLADTEQALRSEAERVNAELGALSARKTAFLAQMSHEVRTPLNAIIGFADMLGDGLVGPLNPRQADYLAEVRSSGSHLVDLIGDVLDVGKAESGTDEIHRAPFELTAVLTRCLMLFKPEAGRRGVELGTGLSDAAPLTIDGDERKVRQIVLNLLSNALKFTPRGGAVELSLRADERSVVIEVRDTGHGVGPDDIDRIFEEYRQTLRGSAQGSGTGLGLPLARRFAEMHGGSLDVVSSPGAGSTFTLTLPRVAAGGATQSSRRGGEAEDLAGFARPLDEVALRARMAMFPGVLAFGSTLVGGLTVVVQVLRPVRPRPHDYHPAALGVLAVVCAGFAVWVTWRRARLTTRDMYWILALGTGGFTMADYFVGVRNQPYGVMVYVWVAIGAVTFLPTRWAVVETALVGAAYGGLLVIQQGSSDPVARWLLVMTMVAVTGVAVRVLIQRAAALTAAERTARNHLHRVRMELIEANEHKTHFLATLSHELRTPLNAIIGFSDVLADELFGPLTTKQREYVADLSASGRQLLALITDVLDLAKLEAGRMELDMREGVDVGQTIREACDAIDDDGLGSVVTLSMDGVRDICADRRTLRRIVANLVAELLDASGDSPVTVGASVRGPDIVFEVRRAGLDPTLGTRRADEDGGYPLRAVVAEALAELHGGRVETLPDGWLFILPADPVTDHVGEPVWLTA